MTYPTYDFNDPTLDYDLVNATVNDMFSDYVHKCGCCGTPYQKDIKNQATVLMQAIAIDKASGDVVRFKDGVKSAYLILYTNVSS